MFQALLLRQEMVTHYEGLYRSAERRRLRAEWRVRRLELTGRLQALLTREAAEWERELAVEPAGPAGMGDEVGAGAALGGSGSSSGVREGGRLGAEGEMEEEEEEGKEEEEEEEEEEGELAVAERGEKKSHMTWVESSAKLAGTRGRRTWVASLVEAGGSAIDAGAAGKPRGEEEEGERGERRGQERAGEGEEEEEQGESEPAHHQLLPVLQPPSLAWCGGARMPEQLPRPLRKPVPGAGVHQTTAQHSHSGTASAPEQEAGTARTDSSRGHAPSSVAMEIIYGSSPAPNYESTRGQAPPSSLQTLLYNDVATGDSDVAPKPSRGLPPPSTIQDIMYAAGGTSAGSASSRGHAPASTVQLLLYPHSPGGSAFTSCPCLWVVWD